MRILVISDTHGHMKLVRKVFEKENMIGKIDTIVHCGDYITDAMDLEAELGVPIIKCSGNCDYAGNVPYSILETECGKFLVTHGHLYGVDYDHIRLGYKAEELGCIGAIYGHTHRPVFVKEAGLIFMNPGSIPRPRDGSNGSYGILETSEDGLSGKINYL